jgi:2-hydroxy-3-keto-5-methylthiopentenyl-1-phosphate phosphatase
MSPPVDSPFFSPANGIDKAAVVRDALRRVPVVAFAGDGRPDLEPALQVPPERRLARGWLADQLRKAGERFIPFDAWPEVADRLLEERAS